MLCSQSLRCRTSLRLSLLRYITEKKIASIIPTSAPLSSILRGSSSREQKLSMRSTMSFTIISVYDQVFDKLGWAMDGKISTPPISVNRPSYFLRCARLMSFCLTLRELKRRRCLYMKHTRQHSLISDSQKVPRAHC